jgi:lysyl endopeptidase
MKKIYILFIVLSCSFGLTAQTTDLGGPFAWRTKAVLPKQAETQVMAGFDQAQRAYEDAINDITKESPWKFGYKYDTDFSTGNSGTWTTLSNGAKLWQIELVCEDALTINLLLDNFYLPDGAYLYLYDTDRTNRVGAYTSRNNSPAMKLGTELVHGDHIVVEYYEPAAVAGQGHFTIVNVVHGYRSLNKIQGDLAKGLEDAGDCNIDVNCPLGVGWEDQINSVAMIVVGGDGICSGALINNTCSDGTPYFLTANHCLGGEAFWAFRFNWESPPGTEICAAVGNSVDPGPPYDQTANGATVLFSSAGSDVGLLEITNMTLTDAQTWNCFYAGWDHSDALTVTQTTGIHHPSGDLKKICREDDAPYHSTAAGAQVWWIDDWEQGVTEPGSSGSPLFDQNGRIIGQLYGGASACAGTVNNGDYDYYGRFGISWAGVSTWLAPGACGTTMTNDGYDPTLPTLPDDAGISGIVEPIGNYCTDQLDPVVTLRNYGTNTLTNVDIYYNIDGGTNSVYNWSGSLAPNGTVDVALPTMTSAGGTHAFNAYTDLPNGNADTNPLNDDGASSYDVTVGGLPITLNFTTDCWGYESAWQIIDGAMAVVQEGGNPLAVPGGLGNAGPGDPGSYGDEVTVTETFCLAVGCYDLVVYDDYGDGLDGTSSGCGTDGYYALTDEGNNLLAELMTLDFGDSESQNFCVTPPCDGTVGNVNTEENCFGDCDGTITINMTGGNAPFTYDIGAGPQVGNIFTGLCQDVYNITITDALACTQTVPITLNGPAEITASPVVTDELTGNDGSINLNPAGGTGTLDFSWTGPGGFTSTSEDVNGLTEGTYAVTITDDNGCSVDITGIQVDSQVGIKQNETLRFEVYPNPSTGSVTLKFNRLAEEESLLVLTDVSGRVIKTVTVQGQSQVELDLSEVANGVYHFHLLTPAEKSVVSIVRL